MVLDVCFGSFAANRNRQPSAIQGRNLSTKPSILIALQTSGDVRYISALNQAKRLQNYCRQCKNDSLAANRGIRQLPVDSP